MPFPAPCPHSWSHAGVMPAGIALYRNRGTSQQLIAKSLEGNLITPVRDCSTGSLEKVGVMRSICIAVCIAEAWGSLSRIALAAAGTSSKSEVEGFFFPLVCFSSRCRAQQWKSRLFFPHSPLAQSVWFLEDPWCCSSWGQAWSTAVDWDEAACQDHGACHGMGASWEWRNPGMEAPKGKGFGGEGLLCVTGGSCTGQDMLGSSSVAGDGVP